MDKLQSALINKALQGGNTSNPSSIINPYPSNEPSLSRHSTSPFTDRTQQYSNLSNNHLMNTSTGPIGEPFQIKIDTHIIQKDLGPPSTFTTTTFGGMPNNMPMYSPLKKSENKENIFMDGRYSYSPYGSRLTGGNVSSRLY